jgi:hypothetical protein
MVSRRVNLDAVWAGPVRPLFDRLPTQGLFKFRDRVKSLVGMGWGVEQDRHGFCDHHGAEAKRS